MTIPFSAMKLRFLRFFGRSQSSSVEPALKSTSDKSTRFEQGISARSLAFLTNPGFVLYHTRNNVFITIFKKREEIRREKGRRIECPKEATPNNQSVKLFGENNRMLPQVVRNPIGEIYGYMYKRKAQTTAARHTSKTRTAYS